MKKIFNMKRIIQLLLVLGIVVQSLLFIENVKKQNVNHWYHLFDENSVTISLNEDNDVLYQNIQYLSEKYNNPDEEGLPGGEDFFRFEKIMR